VRFLVDENLPGRFVDFMRAAGHEASHVAEHDLLARPDEEVMAFARREGSVVVSYDADLATIAVLGGDALPSIVLFRDQRRRPEELAQLLLHNLGEIEWSLSDGAIAVFDPARVRVRSLPIEPD